MMTSKFLPLFTYNYPSTIFDKEIKILLFKTGRWEKDSKTTCN